jgi:membrane protease YdiL (CAAX protease family)
MRRQGMRLLVCYVAFVAVGCISAIAHTRIAHAGLRHPARVESIAFLFAGLTCFCIASPWLVARPKNDATTHASGRAAGIAAVALLVVGLLALSIQDGLASGAQAIARSPVLILPAVVLVVVAEEVFFREALPSGLARQASAPLIRLGALLTSQLMYAAAHIPATLVSVGPESLLSLSSATSLVTKLVFGLILLWVARSGESLVERSLIHGGANLAVLVAPTSPALGAWRGSLFAALAALALAATNRLSERRAPQRAPMNM